MSGYSGGAQVTGWAAQLQPTYAPDVKLTGAALGGLPADLAAVMRQLNGGPFGGLEFAIAQSFLRPSNLRPSRKMLAQKRAKRSRPSYSNGTGGIDMKTSSVSRSTSAPDIGGLPPLNEFRNDGRLGR
jgi:hypothetical protein